MIRTAIFLGITLIALPIISLNTGAQLSVEQWNLLYGLGKMAFAAALICFAVSEISGNYSQVDKLWSILPIVYVWFIAYQSDFTDRSILAAALVTIWGARLTFNFARRGGYHLIPWRGEEDYRWAHLRAAPPLNNRFNWTLFNLFFVSLYQNGLILAFTLPAVAAQAVPEKPLYWADYLIAAFMLGFVILETIADQQQYNFQTHKYRLLEKGEPLEGMYAQGFRSSGLWGLVRHPNYACEQAVWICFYFFSVSAGGQWLNWSAAGAILLMLLFLGSSDFSEKISAGKYPGYSDYQRRVPRFVPGLK